MREYNYKKKMLVVYPNNFLQGAMGTNNRVKILTSIFKDMGFMIDLFSYENFSNNSSFENFKYQNKEKIIRNLFLYDFKDDYIYSREKILRNLRRKIYNKIYGIKKYLADWTTIGVHNYFQKVVTENSYDIIIMFYTYLAPLLEGYKGQAKLIYFMEDSMFLQQYSWDGDKIRGLTIGKLIDEEIERIKTFDEIICVSNDEKLMYEKITGLHMHYIPYIIPQRFEENISFSNNRKWDLLFIGFDNPFNVEGLNWFLEKVYFLLNKNIKILLVGSAASKIKKKFNNIDIICFAPDLEEIYRNVKISICPMLRGTGMKVKVIEAMAHSLPVVCSERGIDGFADKSKSGCLVTNNSEEFAWYINELTNNISYYNETVNQIKSYYNEMFCKEKYIPILEKIL